MYMELGMKMKNKRITATTAAAEENERKKTRELYVEKAHTALL